MYQLAQLNVARLLKPIDDPQIAEFVNNLDQINSLAESHKGFIWRLKDDSGNATDIKAFSDPMIIANMSVWENIEALKEFTYRSDHVHFMRKRREWFEKPTASYMVMWWIKKGEIPTLEEGKERLDYLNKFGETPYAFTFRNIFGWEMKY